MVDMMNVPVEAVPSLSNEKKLQVLKLVYQESDSGSDGISQMEVIEDADFDISRSWLNEIFQEFKDEDLIQKVSEDSRRPKRFKITEKVEFYNEIF